MDTVCYKTVHTKSIFTKLGLGLGVNSMEGREQKHQKIYRYMQNSTLAICSLVYFEQGDDGSGVARQGDR